MAEGLTGWRLYVGATFLAGGWGGMHNIEPLEQDLDSTVVTWMNAMIWSSMKRCKVTGPIAGFGKLLATV